MQTGRGIGEGQLGPVGRPVDTGAEICRCQVENLLLAAADIGDGVNRNRSRPFKLPRKGNTLSIRRPNGRSDISRFRIRQFDRFGLSDPLDVNFFGVIQPFAPGKGDGLAIRGKRGIAFPAGLRGKGLNAQIFELIAARLARAEPDPGPQGQQAKQQGRGSQTVSGTLPFSGGAIHDGLADLLQFPGDLGGAGAAAGVFSSIARISESSAAGTRGSIDEGGAGRASDRIACRVSKGDAAGNAWRPAASSYSTRPKEKISVAPVSGSPRTFTDNGNGTATLSGTASWTAGLLVNGKAYASLPSVIVTASNGFTQATQTLQVNAVPVSATLDGPFQTTFTAGVLQQSQNTFTISAGVPRAHRQAQAVETPLPLRCKRVFISTSPESPEPFHTSW